jgi:hypothetical protein
MSVDTAVCRVVVSNVAAAQQPKTASIFGAGFAFELRLRSR